MVYTFTTLFTYYECLYLQKNTDIPNHFCVELTPITFLFPVAPRHSRGLGINTCRLKYWSTSSQYARKIRLLLACQKNTTQKAFCWRAHSGPRFGAACLQVSPGKLALYDTCSSDMHVVKETRACACHLPKGNSKIRWYMYSCGGWSESKCRIVGCGHIQIVGNYVPLFTVKYPPPL